MIAFIIKAAAVILMTFGAIFILFLLIAILDPQRDNNNSTSE